MKQTTFYLTFQGCESPGSVNNGYCQDHVNTAECNYDGGDCCGSNVNTFYCVECLCYDDLNCAVSLDLIGNGYCNDESNNANCDFDGGDCCGSCAITDYCSDCLCHEGSPINVYCK